MFCGCGPSPEYSKRAKSFKILKKGTLELVDEIKEGQKLPKSYYTFYFDKNDRAIERVYYDAGVEKRSAKIVYNKNGKISELSTFEKGKYNGVSKFVYDSEGNIEKEMIYDASLNFLFAKKH
jgi:antitoxin component YwqK of YwqJK toxin-antitoxin module